MNVVIVGAGKLGLRVAEALIGGDYSITIVDKDTNKLNKLNQQLDVLTVNEDARDIEVLKQLKIQNFDFLLAVTSSDETNMIISMFAKSLGCKNVIARVRDPEHMNQFHFIKNNLNIDMIVNPDLAITNEIYKYLAEKYTLSNGIFTSGQFSILEFQGYKFPQIIGKSMSQIGEYMPNMLVIALSKKGKIIIPHGEDIVDSDDYIYVAGKKDEIMNLGNKVHEKKKFTDIQKVMLIGGGKTGFYLAQKLSEFGASVKVIEQNKERCQYLSTHLNNVMILHGNGTDIELLEEENIDDMDAFVTATGFDEENLLLALTAKQKGIKDVISKVSHENYSGLIEKMGVDMVLNPLDITASNILTFIQGTKKVISTILIQGQAEIMEIFAHKDMCMIDTPLTKLSLPEGVLIAAIRRDNDVIIPSGDTVIQEGDKVVILSLLSEIGDLEKLLKKRNKTIIQ